MYTDDEVTWTREYFIPTLPSLWYEIDNKSIIFFKKNTIQIIFPHCTMYKTITLDFRHHR